MRNLRRLFQPLAVGVPGFPFAIFRGWYVLAAVFVGEFAVYGTGVYSFLLFVKPISNEFRWSYTAAGGLIAAFYFSAPLALMTDSLIRHAGIKRLVAGGIVIEALGFICLPMASHLWQMYLLRALGGIGKVLYVVTMPVILSKWFSRRFGVAVAVLGCGQQLGGVAVAPVTQYLIQAVGWRSASVAMGLAVLVLALPVSLWMLRVESAAEIGLGLDGDPKPIAVTPAHLPRDSRVLTGKAGTRAPVRELLQDRGFQLMVIGSVFSLMTYCGVLFLQPTMLESVGVSARTASVVIAGTTAFAAIGQLLAGYIIDRLSLNRAVTLQYLLMGLGVLAMLMFIHLFWGWLLVAHAVIFGLAVGGSSPMWITVVKRKMPAAQFPRAWGIWYFIGVVTSILAPIGGGWLHDLSGSFTPALATELAFLGASLPLCLILARRAERG